MNKLVQWIVAIVAQQDGQHAFEYADLEYSILSQPCVDHIKYNLFYYEQRSSIATIKEVQYSSRFGANTFINRRQPFIADIYKPATLTRFFKEAFIPDTPTIEYRYMVILWGHGVALGYLSHATPDPDDPNTQDLFSFLDGEDTASFSRDKRMAVNDELITLNFLRGHLPVHLDAGNFMRTMLEKQEFHGVSDAGNKSLSIALQLISADQLNQTFKDSLPWGKKVDALIANSCYTQLFEMGYSLRETVEMLVASETTVSFAGYNYDSLFQLLKNDPDIGPVDIAPNIRDTFMQRYTAGCFNKQFRVQRPVDLAALSDVSFSANYLAGYQQLLDKVINPLAIDFLRLLDLHDGNIIRDVRNNCLDVSAQPVFSIHRYGVIDFTHFLTEFVASRQKAGDTHWEHYLTTWRNLIPTVNLAFSPAENKKLYRPDRDGKSSSPGFLSIFFPSDGTTDTMGALFARYTGDPGSLVNPNLAPWVKFVNRYHSTISLSDPN